jgi:inorganic pyrophosphatase
LCSKQPQHQWWRYDFKAIPIGGFKMIDKGEADDKIIAVLVDDQVYGHMRDISDLPVAEVNRLKHYFLCKNLPTEPAVVRIDDVYGAEHAKSYRSIYKRL